MTTHLAIHLYTDDVPRPPRWIDHDDDTISYVLDYTPGAKVYVTGTLDQIRTWAETILADCSALTEKAATTP